MMHLNEMKDKFVGQKKAEKIFHDGTIAWKKEEPWIDMTFRTNYGEMYFLGEEDNWAKVPAKIMEVKFVEEHMPSSAWLRAYTIPGSSTKSYQFSESKSDAYCTIIKIADGHYRFEAAGTGLNFSHITNIRNVADVINLQYRVIE